MADFDALAALSDISQTQDNMRGSGRIAMREQVGDVAQETNPTTVRLKRHTWKSRVALGVGLALMMIGVTVSLLNRDYRGDLSASVCMLSGLGIQYFARRWRIEVIKPLPQTDEDCRSYKRLQVIEIVSTVVGLVAICWLALIGKDGTSLVRWGAAALVMVALLGSYTLTQRARERLFDKIARQEDGYGF